MQQIDIDFEVWKELTLRRSSENVSYNDVIRELLGLSPAASPAPGTVLFGEKPPGYSFRNLFLPDGTKLRARYKGTTYYAEIRDGRWLDHFGKEHASPSAAANNITATSVNGWRFWEARRPQDTEWRKIDALPQSQS